jgi:hypothetical protein
MVKSKAKTQDKQAPPKRRNTITINGGTARYPILLRLLTTDATKRAFIKGSLVAKAAQEALPGEEAHCSFSIAGMSDSSVFDHPVADMATHLSRAYVVTVFYEQRDSRGIDGECVKYAHNLERFVRMNDKGTLKDYIKEHPEFVHRTFELFPPPPPQTAPANRNRGARPKQKHRSHRPQLPAGSLRRARIANLVNERTYQRLQKEELKNLSPTQHGA